MEYKKLFDVAVLAGELMAQNGAETYRIEDTMDRILRLAHLKTCEVFVTMTGFSVTLDDPTMDSMTIVRRISKRGLNLSRIDRVNTISRQLDIGEISWEEALTELTKIKKELTEIKGNYLPMMVVGASFTLMFGGNVPEIMSAALAGLFSAFLLTYCKKYQMHLFLQHIVCAFGIALAAYLFRICYQGTFDLDVVIIASIMPFVPGVAITNAVFDTLHGDYLSGLARGMEAIVIAAGIAIGTGAGMSFCHFLVEVI